MAFDSDKRWLAVQTQKGGRIRKLHQAEQRKLDQLRAPVSSAVSNKLFSDI